MEDRTATTDKNWILPCSLTLQWEIYISYFKKIEDYHVIYEDMSSPMFDYQRIV